MTSIFQAVESHEVPVVEAAAAKKNGWLPVLVVLFLISYGLMTMLIIEQGRTIESQRALIKDLFHDSTELSAVRSRAQEQRARTAQDAQVTQDPSSQTSIQTPSTQVPTQHAPSSQAQARTQSQAAKPKPFQMPSRPAADINERGRTLITI